MNEHLRQPDPGFEREMALRQLVEQHMPEDAEFLADMADEAVRLNYVYGALLEQGKDPDEVLHELGVTEEE